MYKCLVIILLFVVIVNANNPKGAPKGAPPLVDGAPPGFVAALKGKYDEALELIKKVFTRHLKPEETKKEVDGIMKQEKVSKDILEKLKMPKH